MMSDAKHKLHTATLPPYEFAGYNWDDAREKFQPRGWNHIGVSEAYVAQFQRFLTELQNRPMIDFTPETMDVPSMSYIAHNVIHTFGYVLALVKNGATSISVLDWGGALGHYYHIAQQLLPNVELQYTCHDLPALTESAKKLSPSIIGDSDVGCLYRRYDLIFASGSLHYAPQWKELLQSFGKATTRALYITRLPIVSEAPSYVFLQRPYEADYQTEYIGWALRRTEFLDEARASGLSLAREFLIEPVPQIVGAPEQPSQRGFLFMREPL